MFPDPLSAPRPRFEPGTNAKSIACKAVKPGAQVVAGCPGYLAVPLPVDSGKDIPFVTVQNDPIHEIETFVHLFGYIRNGNAKIRDAAGASTELNLVFRDVDVHERTAPIGQRGPYSDQDIHLGLIIGYDTPQFLRVQKVGKLQ